MVVNRSKLGKSVYLIDYLFGYQASLVKYLCALYYSVTYSGDFRHRVYNLALAGSQDLDQLFKSLGVGGEVAVCAVFVVLGGDFVGNVTADTDSVAVALCDDGFIIHIEKLIL